MNENILAHTTQTYKVFQDAFEYFNKNLFDGKLANLLVTLQRGKAYKGYFSSDRFDNRDIAESKINELAMNPDCFTNRTDEEILSTLAHEMCHAWQFEYGKQVRKGYHDKQWANKMEEIGLIPSTTGAPGGKKTGQKVTHYIEDGGNYQRVYKAFSEAGGKLNWQSTLRRGKKTESKQKYTCPNCKLNAWGKPADNPYICGVCYAADEEIRYLEPVIKEEAA